MRFLLDTNVVSETSRPAPDRRVLAWFAEVSPQSCRISVVTIAELTVGIARQPDERRRAALDAWFEATVRRGFEGRILHPTERALGKWLEVLAARRLLRDPASGPDVLIAAMAWDADSMLVTNDRRDYAGTGVTTFNPWTGITSPASKA